MLNIPHSDMLEERGTVRTPHGALPPTPPSIRFNALGGSRRVVNRRLHINVRPSQLPHWPPLTIDHLVAQARQGRLDVARSTGHVLAHLVPAFLVRVVYRIEYYAFC